MSLIEDAEGVGGIITTKDSLDKRAIFISENELAALKALWIGKTQQEPEAWHIPNSTEVTKSLDCKQPPYEPLYTHAQDVAEIQAEALEKAAADIYEKREMLLSAEMLREYADKLRKGETL